MPAYTASPAFSLHPPATSSLRSSFRSELGLCSCRLRTRSQFVCSPRVDRSHFVCPRVDVTFSPPSKSRISGPVVVLTATNSGSAEDAVYSTPKVRTRPKRPAHGRHSLNSTDARPVAKLKTPSSSSEALRLMGRARLAAGDFSGARSLFQRSVDIDPTNGRAWQDAAKLEGRMSQSLQGKVKILETAIVHNPDNAYLWQSLAFAKLRLSLLDEAREHCQQGIKRDPSHVSLYATWAAVEEKLRNYAEARDIYEKAGSLSKPGAKMYHSWGQMELRQGNEGRALDLFQKGLTCDPVNHYIWQSLGSIARANHEIDRARDCFQNALKSDEQNVVVLEEWAKLEVQEGNYGLARALFARGAAADREDARILHSWSLFEYQVRVGTECLKTMRICSQVIANFILLHSCFTHADRFSLCATRRGSHFRVLKN